MANKKTIAVTVSSHPEYDVKKSYWETCYYLISLGDPKTVKDGKDTYLPKLTSQVNNNAYQGAKEYTDFLNGAIWSEIPRESRDNILGEMFAKPSTYKLPTAFKSYESNITNNGTGINNLEATIATGQLEMSRIGLMAYVLDNAKLPKVAIYNTLDIFNWNQFTDKDGNIKYDLVELRSQVYEMNKETLEYSLVTKYIIHGLSPKNNYYKVTLDEKDYKDYRKSYAKRASHPSYEEPEYKGFKLNYVPFVVINATNIDGALDIPVLYSQVDLSLHAYQDSALFKKKCKMQTWAALSGTGLNKEQITNGIKADGIIPLKTGGKIAYISPSKDGADILENAWNKSLEMAKSKGIQISEKTQVESGIALEKRMDNQSNAYRTIVHVRNEGILKMLDYIQDWGSLKIIVTEEFIKPFTDFNIAKMTTKEYLELGTSYLQGTLGIEDFYMLAKKGGRTQAKDALEFESDFKDSGFEG